MKLIIGLGNPGPKYAKVRHNLGFMVLDELARKCTIDNVQFIIDQKFKSEIIKLPDLILVKPQTYMNNSGMAVKLLTTAYNLVPSALIVVHDDLDLRLGQIKVRMGGSAAGHHGVESIIEALGTDQFTRVRMGIGNQKPSEKFVLEPFEPHELPQVKHMIKQTIKILESLM